MKNLKVKMIVGVSGIITVGALAGALAFGNVDAANHGNYKNQERTQSISADVAELTAEEKGIFDVDADGDGVTDIYSNFDDFKKAMELAAEQVDANTENIAAESDVYDSSKTYALGELCIKDGEIYSCTSEIATAEEWDEAHWEKASLSGSVNSLNDSLSTLNSDFVSNIYVGEDGKLHKVQGGADTVLPFNKNAYIVSDFTGSFSNGIYTFTKNDLIPDNEYVFVLATFADKSGYGWGSGKTFSVSNADTTILTANQFSYSSRYTQSLVIRFIPESKSCNFVVNYDSGITYNICLSTIISV